MDDDDPAAELAALRDRDDLHPEDREMIEETARFSARTAACADAVRRAARCLLNP